MPTSARAAFIWAAVSNALLQHKLMTCHGGVMSMMADTSYLICRSCLKHQDYDLLPLDVIKPDAQAL